MTVLKFRVSSASHLLHVDLDKRSAISSARLSSPLGRPIHRITPQPQALVGGLEKGIGATHTLGEICLTNFILAFRSLRSPPFSST